MTPLLRFLTSRDAWLATNRPAAPVTRSEKSSALWIWADSRICSHHWMPPHALEKYLLLGGFLSKHSPCSLIQKSSCKWGSEVIFIQETLSGNSTSSIFFVNGGIVSSARFISPWMSSAIYSDFRNRDE